MHKSFDKLEAEMNALVQALVGPITCPACNVISDFSETCPQEGRCDWLSQIRNPSSSTSLNIWLAKKLALKYQETNP